MLRDQRAAVQGQLGRCRAQIGIAADAQCAGLNGGGACVTVCRGQVQCAGPSLKQGPRAGQHAVECGVGGLLKDQRAVVGDVARDRGGAADQRTAADLGMGVGIGGIAQAQGAVAGFDQVAGAGQFAVQGQRGAGGDIQARRLAQRKVARHTQGCSGVQRAALEVQRAGAQVGVLADLHGALGQGRAAAEGIYAAQRQGAGAGFMQCACAVDRAGQAQRGAGRHIQATRLRQGEGTGGVEGRGGGQGAAVQADCAAAGAQIGILADLYAAALDKGAAQVGVLAA